MGLARWDSGDGTREMGHGRWDSGDGTRETRGNSDGKSREDTAIARHLKSTILKNQKQYKKTKT